MCNKLARYVAKLSCRSPKPFTLVSYGPAITVRTEVSRQHPTANSFTARCVVANDTPVTQPQRSYSHVNSQGTTVQEMLSCSLSLSLLFVSPKLASQGRRATSYTTGSPSSPTSPPRCFLLPRLLGALLPVSPFSPSCLWSSAHCVELVSPFPGSTNGYETPNTMPTAPWRMPGDFLSVPSVPRTTNAEPTSRCGSSPFPMT